ncbi:hypothetical protein LPN04_31350 [Rugamonas sp. A1-17]|nr:hypothetical protein [Rugamonas sp. A1-17]
MQLKQHFRNNGGWSMTEMIAATAVAGVVLASGLAMKLKGDDQAAGRSTADLMSSFQQVAIQYFTANRIEIEAAMAGDATKAGIHCLINVPANGAGGTVSTGAANHTCAFDATSLQAKGVWPSSLQINAGSGRYVAIARQVLAAGVPTGADEMLVVLAPVVNGNVLTTGTIPFAGDVKRALEQIDSGSTALGGNGGYIPPGRDYGECQYNATVKQVCGATWKVNLSDFLN